MLTKLAVRNFKLFRHAEIELAQRTVFVGPNNSGKSSALQALALWSVGVRRWLEKRGDGNVPRERAGVTINRRDLLALPVPSANLLWRDVHVSEGFREEGATKTRSVLIEIDVEGVSEGRTWSTALEFYYANEESFYCRSRLGSDGVRMEIPAAAGDVRLAYLPPMSGLASNETRLDEGALDVRIGEGRTAEVLRNLCWRAFQSNPEAWSKIVVRMRDLFGVTMDDPRYVKERGEISLSYRASGVRLDLSASGRGQQQTLLLLAHMAANPGSVLLLDEPDAHLEVLRQRQIYGVLTEIASETKSQIIAASHSEIVLNEAADRDVVVAFLGRPHRIDDRGSQLVKSLKEIGFDQYLQAETTGWVLYLEGSTDLAVLRAFAEKLGHPARLRLERPFTHYVGNQPAGARRHFYGLREACSDLKAVAVFDRLQESLHPDPNLRQFMWRRREIENYLCQRETLLAWAEREGECSAGELFAVDWRACMAEVVDALARARATLRQPEPWHPDVKVSDEFLDPVFQTFYESVGLPLLVRKTDYHVLAPFVSVDQIDPQIVEVLEAIESTAAAARPRGEAKEGTF
ncbi:MAG TPA: AAA family ATPase [Planctomycetota bacterium]|nr:AAA family ATPase [Planctomycetota bacterium]